MITVLSVLLGLTLGFFFYGGLWFTVRHLAATSHPVLLTMGSFWIRLLPVLAGFLFITQGRWQNALLCLAGFLAARVAVSRWVRCT
jgi:F1F0 ATPase subunit 2